MLQVTHDFAEAGLLGDVAIMLDRGASCSRAIPEQVFRQPASPYIADFLGAENVFAGTARPFARSRPIGTRATSTSSSSTPSRSRPAL